MSILLTRPATIDMHGVCLAVSHLRCRYMIEVESLSTVFTRFCVHDCVIADAADSCCREFVVC